MSYMIRRSSLAHSPPPPSMKKRRCGNTSSSSSSSSSSTSKSSTSTSTNAEEDDEAWTSKTDNLVLKQNWTGGKRKSRKEQGGVKASRIPSLKAGCGSRTGNGSRSRSGSGSGWRVEYKSRSKKNQDQEETRGEQRSDKSTERAGEVEKQKNERAGKSLPPGLELSSTSDPSFTSSPNSDSDSNAKVGSRVGDEGEENDKEDDDPYVKRQRQRRPSVEGRIISPTLEGGLEEFNQKEHQEDDANVQDVNGVEINNLESTPLSAPALTSITHTNPAIDGLRSKSDENEDEPRKGGRRGLKRSAGIPSRFKHSPDPTPQTSTSASASGSGAGAVSAMNTAARSNSNTNSNSAANSDSASKARSRSKPKSRPSLKRDIKSGEQDGNRFAKKKVMIDETLNRTRIISDLPQSDQTGLIGPPNGPSIPTTPDVPKIPQFRTSATSFRQRISAPNSDPTSTLAKDSASGLPSLIRALRYRPSGLIGTDKGKATVIRPYPDLELSSDSDTDTLHDNDPHHDHEDDPGHDQRIEYISTNTPPETGSETIHPNSIVEHTLDNGPGQSLSKLGAHINGGGSIETLNLIQAVEASGISKFNQTEIPTTPTSLSVIREPERESEKGEGEGPKRAWYSYPSRGELGPEENHKFMEEWRKPEFRFEKYIRENPHCTSRSAESLKLVSPDRWLDFVNVCTQQSRTQSSSRMSIPNLISSTSTPGPTRPSEPIQPLSAPSLHEHTNTPLKIEIGIPRWGVSLIPAQIDRDEDMEVTTYLPSPTQLRSRTQSQAQASVTVPTMLPQTQPSPPLPYDTSHLSRPAAGAKLERGGAFRPAIDPHYFSEIEIETPVRTAWNLEVARQYTYNTHHRLARHSAIDPGSQM